MIRLLIEKELREIVGSTKFAITFGASAVLILLAFYVGARHYAVGQAQYEAGVAENLRQMEGVTTERYYDLRPRLLLPPQPLAVLVSGISNDIGRNIEVRGQGALVAESSRFGEDPVYAVFRFLDLEFLFGVVLSLFAILFAYDSISGEKERGTLRLTFSNAVPRPQYLVGKLAGTVLGLCVPLLIPILLGCLVLGLLGVPMTGDAWTRLTLIVLAALLYLCVFLALSVFVSALTQRSATSFLILLVLWILAVFIVPRTAVLIAGRTVDVPRYEAILAEVGRYERQLFRESMNALRPRGGGPPPDEAAVRALQQRQQELADARAEKVEALRSRRYRERENRLALQQARALGLARLSPTAAFSLAAAELAGTSLRLKQRYQEAAEAYQETFDRFLRTKTGGQTTGNAVMILRFSTGESTDEPIDVREVPAFTFAPPDLGAVLAHALPDLGLLALFVLLFFSGAFLAFLRYDVR